jgi:hypothetical protein
VYQLSFLLKHDSVDGETAFEVLQGPCKLAVCQDKSDDEREMTTPLLIKILMEEHVSVVYTGDKAIAGSRVTRFSSFTEVVWSPSPRKVRKNSSGLN